jgi:predicted branched-subunit amino acid permease
MTVTPRLPPLLRGARDALLLPAWVVSLSMVGIGSLARDSGVPLGAAVLSSLLIWAAPAQAILFAGLAAGVAWPALALAVGLSSIRFLPMTVVLMPLLRRPGQGLAVQLLAAHLVAVTAFVEAMRRLPGEPPPERMAYFLGFAQACLWLSALATWIGFVLVGFIPTPLAAGLLFLTPIFFTLSLIAGARSLGDGLAIGAGFVLTPLLSPVIGERFDLLATGLIGGTTAYLLDRARRRR